MKHIKCWKITACLLLSVALFSLMPIAASAETDSLYVEDGCVMNLDAFDPSNVNLQSKTWASSVGDAEATLTGNWISEDKGISYSLSAVGNTGIDLGFDNFPKGDFTVEMVIMPHGLTSDGDKVTYTNTYGLSYGYGFAFGAFKGYVYPALRASGVSSPTADPRYCSYQTMWYYAQTGSNFSWLLDDYSFNTYMDEPLVYTVSGTIGTKAVYTVTANGEEVGKVTISSPVANSTTDGKFNVLTSFPCTVYAIRVYDRVLTQEEKEQNHFADLANYFGVTDAGTRLSALSDARKAAIYGETASMTFENGSIDALDELLDAPDITNYRIASPATEEERLQNHFVDLVEKADMDFGDFFDADADAKKAVYAAFADVEKGQYKDIELYAIMMAALGDDYALCAAVLTHDVPAIVRNEGIRYTFRVNRTALALLEKNVKVTLGAVVGLGGEDYFDGLGIAAALDGGPNAHTFTVYSSAGDKLTAHFTEEGGDIFTVFVAFGDMEAYTAMNTDLVAAVYVKTYNEKTGEKSTLTIACGTDDGKETLNYRDIAESIYEKDKDNTEAMEQYLDCRKAELTAYYGDLAAYPVRIAGVDKEDGEKAVWVEYLPEHDPWVDNADLDKAAVKAVYIYYPMAEDPSYMSDGELTDAGALRVFAYLGMPAGTEGLESFLNGMVCVHGGAGHGYATYALEAVKQGFAGIAIDTEGCYNRGGGTKAYGESESDYSRDTFGHKGKDSFNCAEDVFTNQWLYYAVGDTILANSVMRSLYEVNRDCVGLTGISWGGLITSTTICYDYRFVACVPVYISFHMAESVSYSVGSLPSRPYAANLWQDSDMLAASPVPTMILNSAFDHFASVDTSSATYHDLSDGYINIKPGLTHSQSAGASPSEIYRFVKSIIDGENGFIRPLEEITVENGYHFTVELDVPADLTDVKAVLYYRTETIGSYTQAAWLPWKTVELTYHADTYELEVDVPDDALFYFISFNGYSVDLAKIKESTPNGDAFKKGTVYSSTDIVIMDGEKITK